ncbi:MAG: hypothetical protein ACI4F5_04615 [Acutalibacteraceae bacterium]
MKSTLSFHMSEKMNERHNLRKINVPYVDKTKSKENIYYVNQTKEEAFNFLFDEAVNEYNKKQKRNDRKIEDYLKKIQEAEEKQKKIIAQKRAEGASYKEIAKYKKAKQSAYEIIVSLGNIQQNPDFMPGGDNCNKIEAILDEYIKNFQLRNKNAYLYLGSIHKDETGVIHAHLDVIFYSDSYKTGLSRRVSLNRALADMGYTSDEKKTDGHKKQLAVEKWQNSEREQLRNIAKNYGIEIVCGNQSRQHLVRENYIIKKKREELLEQATKINKCVNEINNFLKYDLRGNEYYYKTKLINKEIEFENLRAEYEALKENSISETEQEK